MMLVVMYISMDFVFANCQVSQSVMPAGTSQERTPSRVSKTESAKSATSPQVTDLAEEELAEDQPKPLYVSYAQPCMK